MYSFVKSQLQPVMDSSPKGKETGEFTYYSDWNGFNIPSNVLDLFYKGEFDPLSEKEQSILDLLQGEEYLRDIIGVSKESKDILNTLKHEIAHGLFHTDNEYNKRVLKIISNYDTSLINKQLASKAGYHEEVFNDEINSHSLDGKEELISLFPERLVKELNNLYDEFLEKNGIEILNLKDKLLIS